MVAARIKHMGTKRDQHGTVTAELAELRSRIDEIERRIEDDQQPGVCRVVRWFDRTTDELVGSAPIHGIELGDLQRMFGVGPDDPMYDCYAVTPVQASQLQAYVDAPMLLDRYDYFVEADALVGRGSRRQPRA